MRELEVYAALVLVKTAQISEPFSMDWIKDKPDIQVGSFGVEVTEAIDYNDAEQRQHDLKVLKCQTYKSANIYINNLPYPDKYHSEPIQLPGSTRFSLVSGGGYDDNKPIKLITDAIEKKSRIFCKYNNYERFSRRGLYISDQELRPRLQHFDTDLILKAIKDSIFDVVFINQLGKLIVVDKGDKLTAKEYLFGETNRNDALCEAKRVCGSLDYEICCERANMKNE